MNHKTTENPAAHVASQAHPMPQGTNKEGSTYVAESFDMKLFIVVRCISTQKQIRIVDLPKGSDFLYRLRDINFNSFERETYSTFYGKDSVMEETADELEQLKMLCIQHNIEFELMKRFDEYIHFVRYSPGLPLLMGRIDDKFWCPFTPYLQVGNPGQLLEVGRYSGYLAISEHLMRIEGVYILTLINEDDMMLPKNTITTKKDVTAYDLAVYHESAESYCGNTWEKLEAADLESVIRRLVESLFDDWTNMGCSFEDKCKSSSALAFFCEKYGLRICISFPPGTAYFGILMIMESRHVLMLSENIAKYSDDIIQSYRQWFTTIPIKESEEFDCFCFASPLGYSDGLLLHGKTDTDAPYYDSVKSLDAHSTFLLGYIGNHSDVMDD